MIERVTIIGNGRVGGALAARLRERSVDVDVVDRQHFEEFLTSTSPIGDLLIIAVKDAVMRDVIERTASSRSADLDGVVVIHVNGSLTPDVLAPFHHYGAMIASAHPFQTFRDADPKVLDGVGWGCQASGVQRPTSDVQRPTSDVREFVEMTGGVFVDLGEMTPEEKRLYHASAVAASNYAYAAYELGRQLAGRVGISAETFLIPIMKQTFENAADALRDNTAFGVTGPIVRGDVEGVQRQYAAIPDDLKPMYRHLSLALLEVVGGKLDPHTVDAIRRSLDASS
jgi:predicted short-subunit dehydrogenase-like oxidoreductase (DUF2520 family)